MFRDQFSQLSKRYLSKKVIFMLDMVISFFASVSVILVLNSLANRNLLTLRFVAPYMLVALAATALMSWIMRSYQIIIRHLVVRDVVVFGVVALGKALLIALLL